MLEEYTAPISKKKDDDNILTMGNHTYSFRKDILYNGEELKQFESDYQEIISQLTITDEISLSNKIKKMSNILYKNQRILEQKTIYDPDEFNNMLETEDADLIGFFDELYQGTNPKTKSDKTNNSNKKKLVSLCYFLASINNKYINGIKADIGSYLQTSGASATSIDTLANLGLSVSRMTVNQQKKIVSDEHEQSVDNYCLQNIEKMFVLNIDDYHNIHRRTMPSLLETHNIFHFVTILLNSNPNIPRIPCFSNNILIHNPKGIDSKLIIKKFENYFMNQIGKSYYEQNELWKNLLIEDSYENRIENLNVHNYDGRIQKHQELRSLNNSKLVDFILHPLHSTKDYIECSNLLFKVFERLENTDYLDHYIIPIIADWPGQVNIRRAITLRINRGIASGIPKQILSLIPMIGPLHISLNNLTFNGWKKIRKVIMNRFKNSKDAEYRMMIDLLDNSIPLTLDIYAVLFRSGYFEGYLESVVRVWVLFQRLRRHNYNKAPLVFLSDVKYPSFMLPSFEINVDIKVLPLAWNTAYKPANDNFCDAEKCLLPNNIDSSNGIVLICRHGK
ncbi:unnamed protein product [Rhizophagus irregularis]|nr:unnamed protein product [Rhizophagus irregularis]